MRKILAALLILILLVSFTACSAGQAASLTDRAGNSVTIPAKIERIICASPAASEVIVELGMGDKIIAVDLYGTDVAGLPEVEAIDFSSPDAEALIALTPDLIIGSGHTAFTAGDTLKTLSDAGICVVDIPSSESIAGIKEDILFIAELLRIKDKGQAIVDNMQKIIDDVKKVTDTITEADRKRVFFEISPAPDIYSFGSGTYIDELITIAGGKNAFSDISGWTKPSPESVIERDPQVYFTNVAWMEDAVSEILSRESFKDMSAVKDKQVYLISANASSRPSHNITIALMEMAKAINPDKF